MGRNGVVRGRVTVYNSVAQLPLPVSPPISYRQAFQQTA